MPFNNRNQRLNGFNPLAYVGDNAYQPPEFVTNSRAPTTYDSKNFELGTLWLNRGIDLSIPPTSSDVWMLVSLIANQATWINFGPGSGSVMTLTGNSGGAVGPDNVGNINVVGDGVSIDIVGNPGTNTLTASTTGLVALEYDTDDGNFAIAVNGILDVAGGLNISTASNPVPGNLIAISVSGTTNHAVQVGNSTGSLTSIPNGTTGQVLTAQTGADPIWTTISVPGGGGALVFIESQTASGVAELNFTTGITSTYNNYLVILTNIQPTVAGKDFIVQLSTNGRASYITTGYKTSTATTNGIIMLEANGGNPSVTSFINGPTYILNATSGAHYVASSDSTMTISDPAIPNIFVDGGAGFYTTPNIVVNAFKFLFQDASNFSGTVSLYGYSESSGGSGSNSDILGNSSISLNLTTSPTFIGFYGGIDATVGSASIVMPRSGTFSKWYINVATNTNTSTSDFALNVNGVDTALAISVGAGATGVFSDLTNTVSVSAGDLVCVSSTQATVRTARGSQTILFT